MNGLIKSPELGPVSLSNVGSFGALAVAFCSVSAVFFILFTGGSV